MARPSSHRVATLHMAGLFEPPPAMMAEMRPWVESVYAGHVIAQTDQRIAAVIANRVQGIKENLANARAWLRASPAKVKRLKPGQSIKVWIGDPTTRRGTATGIKRIEWYGDLEENYVIGYSEKKNVRYPTEDDVFERGESDVMDYDRAIDVLQWSINDSIAKWEKKIPHIRTDKPFDEKGLMDAHMVRKEALRYVGGRKPKEYKTVTKRKFPIDLTGWKYLQEGVEDLPGLAAVNRKIDERNEQRQRDIDQAEKNLAAAKRLFKMLQQGDMDKDPRKDHWGIYHWDAEIFEKSDSEGWWDTSNVVKSLPEGPSEPRIEDWNRYGYGTSPYKTIDDAQAEMEERLTTGDVGTILAANKFTELTCEVWFKKHTTRGGVWKSSDMTLQIDVWHPRPRTVPQFEKGLFEIRRILRHELQHVGQDALRIILGLQEDAGLPPKEIREPGYKPSGRKEKSRSTQRIKHPRRDVEFQTDLSDAVDRFERALRKRRKTEWRQYLRQFVGIEDTRRWTNDFFRTWKQTNPDKWRKAVKEFVAEIGRRGIQIPAESSDIGSPVDVPAPDLFDDLQKKVARKAMGKPHHA